MHSSSSAGPSRSIPSLSRTSGLDMKPSIQGRSITLLHFPEAWTLFCPANQRSPEGHQEEVQSQEIEHFSTNSLRKTFGRKIFKLASSQGQGELALIKLSELFNHSNASITRIYLGIKEDEMLSTYDLLEF